MACGARTLLHDKQVVKRGAFEIRGKMSL